VSDAQNMDSRTLIINAIDHSVFTHSIAIVTREVPLKLLDACIVPWISFETVETSIQSPLQ
jgi:hypothetical protein